MQNQLRSDIRRIHFGFTLGTNMMDFGITHSNAVDENGNSLYMAVPTRKIGFSVGVISDLKILECLNLRFVPLLSFGDRQNIFVNQFGQPAPKSYILKSTTLDFPLYFKYRANRKNNYRPYLIAGGSISIDIGREQGYLLLLKPMDAGIEFGIGCDFYLPYFKFAPELKFRIGMMDILERNRYDLTIPKDIIYTNAIEKLTSRMFILTFNFE